LSGIFWNTDLDKGKNSIIELHRMKNVTFLSKNCSIG